MAANKKYRLKKILSVSVWIILASGVVVLLVAAINKKNTDRIHGIDIHISGTRHLMVLSAIRMLTGGGGCDVGGGAAGGCVCV